MSYIKPMLFTAMVLGASATAMAQTDAGASRSADSTLQQYGAANICRAVVATVEHRGLDGLKTNHTAANLVVSYSPKNGGARQNIKCHVNIADGKAQWGKDGGRWHTGQVSIATNAEGALVVQQNQSPARTFTQADLKSGSKP